MDKFEEIISFETLYKAHSRARLSKRHKKEVVLFEVELSKNLWQIHNDLKYGRYKVGGYHNFMIYDPKEREIQAIGYRDRVVQHCICDNYLMPLLQKILIYDNCACRKGKGTSFALSRWRYFMAEHYKKFKQNGYFIKIDVSKYFPSINHDVLKQKLVKIVNDKRVLSLLFDIIDSYNYESNRGLPMGNQTSQCFALLYLNDVDKFVKEELKIKFYVRYMDDMLLIVEDILKAKKCIFEISNKLKENDLTVNPKSQSIRVSRGVDFLGWKFFMVQMAK